MATIPDLTLDTGLPANLDAEKTILGAILLDCDAYYAEAIRLGLKGSDFWLDSHRRIWKHMRALMDAGSGVDLVTLSESLDRSKETDGIGGRAYLASLTEGLPRRPVIKNYVPIVRGKSATRSLMTMAEKIITAAGCGQTPEEILEMATGEIDAMRSSMNSNGGLQLFKGSDIDEQDTPMILAGCIPDETTIGAHGRPGDGKTTVTLLIAADLSRGRTPYSAAPCTPRNVLVMSNEDSPSRIRKLFAAAGGDLARLWVENSDDLWMLPELAKLEESMKLRAIRCVIVDSLASHSGKIDLNSHADTSKLLVPLRSLAEKYHCAIFVIHHLNKSISVDHIAKVAGSIGITASFRHNLHIVPDPDNPDLRLLINGKSNLIAPGQPALRFKIFPVGWDGESSVTLDEVYALPNNTAAGSQSATAVDRAAQWLKSLLAGGFREQQEIQHLASAEGISEATLRRAKNKAGVKSKRADFGGQWFWFLPANESGSEAVQ
jgi:RecA/RadA recombinase